MRIREIPIGVFVFSTILIVTSVQLLSYMPSYEFYKQVNHEWKEPFIQIRFVGSYIFRIIGLFCGVGILFLNNFVRKFLIGFSIYALFTLPLRHTYSSMFFFTEPIYRTQGSMFSLETFTWIAVGLCWLKDGAFSLAVIYYFTRPKLVEKFIGKKECSNEKP